MQPSAAAFHLSSKAQLLDTNSARPAAFWLGSVLQTSRHESDRLWKDRRLRRGQCDDDDDNNNTHHAHLSGERHRFQEEEIKEKVFGKSLLSLVESAVSSSTLLAHSSLTHRCCFACRVCLCFARVQPTTVRPTGRRDPCTVELNIHS